MLWILAMACAPNDAPKNASLDAPDVDADGDGWGASQDCDDNEPGVHPGSEEICDNGRDDNCNGTADGCDWSGGYMVYGTVLSGTEVASAFGSALAICDANGDGVDDVVVGAPWYDKGTGAVSVFYGPITEDRDANYADYTVTGEHNEWAGLTVDCRRDVDGDGMADILVGAPGGSDAGTTYVVPGLGTGRAALAYESSCAWTGFAESDKLGYDLVAIAADDDETDELAASLGPNAPGTNHFGAVYVFDYTRFGIHDTTEATAYVYGDKASGRIDFAVGNAGDLDGDGLEELAVTGTDYSHAEVLVFEAPFVGPIPKPDADIRIVGAEPGDRWSGIGHADLDNDGRDDLFFANPNDNYSSGAVYAFFVPIPHETGVLAADMQIAGPAWSSTGTDVNSPGDVDGDGTADLLIGAPNYTGATVYLQYAGDGAGVYDLEKDAQASWQGDAGSWTGGTLAAGDVAGDGIVDFLIASAGEKEGSVTIVPSWDL